jgi:hypothetical protein
MPIQRDNDEERADRIDRQRTPDQHGAGDGEMSQDPASAARPAKAWVRPPGPRTTKMRPVSPSAPEVIVGAVVIVGLPVAGSPRLRPGDPDLCHVRERGRIELDPHRLGKSFISMRRLASTFTSTVGLVERLLPDEPF